MISLLEPFFDVINAEFNGKSWNGTSLMATLEKLSASEALSIKTWEGYSAWSIAIHCAKCKHIVAKDLGEPVAKWAFAEDEWFPAPIDTSDEAWVKDKALFITIHESCMKAIRSLTETGLQDIMPSWKAKYSEVIAFLCTHDSFHGAQIRSMGLPSLKDNKKN